MSDKSPKQVLVAEDDLAMREIMTRKLMSEGFVVKSAEDGKQALDLAIKSKPDLILLDLMMPELDGFSVLESLRNNPDKALADTPVIVLSNVWSSNEILKAKSYSVEDFLVKAYFTPDEVLGKIKEVLVKLGK